MYRLSLIKTGVFAMAIALLVIGCRKEEDFLSTESNGDYIEFHFSKERRTRGNIDPHSGAGGFVSGDKITIFSRGEAESQEGYRQHTITLIDGVWKPQLRWSDLGEGKQIEIRAIYPALDNPGTADRPKSIAHAVRQSQGSQDDFTASDLLYGGASLNRKEAVNITFKHIMARINVDLKGINQTINSVEIRAKSKSLIPIASGKASLDKDADFTWLTALHISSGPEQFSAIVAPLDVDEYSSDDLQVRVNFSSGEPMVYKIPKSQLKNGVHGGGSYMIHLKQKEVTQVDIDFANKKLWVYGINSPAFPGFDDLPLCGTSNVPLNSWFYQDFSGDPELNKENAFICWSPDCGWFDCNKDRKNTPGKSDYSLCWAASASNALHWWLLNNRDYIKLYDELHQNPEFPRPNDEYHPEKKSDIFKYFTSVFHDRGAATYAGIRWFLTGERLSSLPAYRDSRYTDFKGFFTEVLGNGSEVVQYETNLRKEKFNEFIKEAFRNHEAISFTIYYSSARVQHARTIWGVEFDSEGYVSAIYYCDNEVSDLNPTPAYCQRLKIRYHDAQRFINISDDWTFIDKGGNLKNDIIIVQCSRLNLRRDLWKNWAIKNGLLPL